MTVAPRISVCIPTYNYGRFIAAALYSVLAQSCAEYEIIICDNCSDDDTGRIVKAIAGGDQRVRYYRNERDLGMVGNWNRCLDLARGEYIKFLCADDLLHPECLATLLRLMEYDKRVVLATAARQRVTEDLQVLDVLSFSSGEELLPGRVVIRRTLLHGNLIGEPSAVMFRRSAAQRVFQVRYHHIVDLEFWLYLLEQGWFASSPLVLSSFRQHGGQMTVANRVTGKFIQDEFMLLDEYSTKPGSGLSLLERERARFNKAHMIWQTANEYPELAERLLAELWTYYDIRKFQLLSALNRLSHFLGRGGA